MSRTRISRDHRLISIRPPEDLLEWVKAESAAQGVVTATGAVTMLDAVMHYFCAAKQDEDLLTADAEALGIGRTQHLRGIVAAYRNRLVVQKAQNPATAALPLPSPEPRGTVSREKTQFSVRIPEEILEWIEQEGERQGGLVPATVIVAQLNELRNYYGASPTDAAILKADAEALGLTRTEHLQQIIADYRNQLLMRQNTPTAAPRPAKRK